MIYELLTQNFVVRIYALFPQIILDWKAKSADIFTFWMYAPAPVSLSLNLWQWTTRVQEICEEEGSLIATVLLWLD